MLYIILTSANNLHSIIQFKHLGWKNSYFKFHCKFENTIKYVFSKKKCNFSYICTLLKNIFGLQTLVSHKVWLLRLLYVRYRVGTPCVDHMHNL